jgi:uncharacterized membrane protein YdjX (TVP38/TMEM64 family)
MLRFPLRSRLAILALVTLLLASALASGLIIAAGGGPALLAQARETLLALNERPQLVAIVFAVWALVANCLVVPAGTLSVIVGGALLGPFTATLIWTLGQLATAPLLYRLTREGLGPVQLDSVAQRWLGWLGPQAANLKALAAVNGLQATALLRLMPVMPSAPATIIAAVAGIELRTFLAGSVLFGWMRSFYFASLGAALGSLSRLDAVVELLSFKTLAPMLALFAATLAVMIVPRLLPGLLQKKSREPLSPLDQSQT